MTLNPAEINSPVALYIAGVKLDLSLGMQVAMAQLSVFDFTEAPDGPVNIPGLHDRAKALVNDPAAAALFFNHFVQTFQQVMLGYDSTPEKRSDNARLGVFGPVRAYYGSVETQKKGSLHWHLLVWLYLLLSPAELFDKLENDLEFRRRVFHWLEMTINQCLPSQGPVFLFPVRATRFCNVFVLYIMRLF